MNRRNPTRKNDPGALLNMNLKVKVKNIRERVAVTSFSERIHERNKSQEKKPPNAEMLEGMLISPSPTENRIKSQERTPPEQIIAPPEISDIKMIPPKKLGHFDDNQSCVDINSNSIPETNILKNGLRKKHNKHGKGLPVSTDTTSNSVNQSSKSGRDLLKELHTSLNPMLTEPNANEDVRVSRYGRHQKQKENINYVPVELMKFLSKSPPKIKVKKEPAEIMSEIATTEDDATDSKNHSLSQNAAVENQSTVVMSVVSCKQEEVLGLDAINIIGMDVSFDSATDEKLIMSEPVPEKTVDSDQPSYTDSADSSEIAYRTGQIYWAAQNTKTVHWPCIVRDDPISKTITRKHSEKNMEIHVAYFGDRALRGWVRRSHMLPFTGLEDYCVRVENLEFGKLVKRGIKAAIRTNWKPAVEKAEEFRDIEIEKRMQEFDKLITKKASKRKRSISPNSPPYESIPYSSGHPNKKMRPHTPVDSTSQDHNASQRSLHLQEPVYGENANREDTTEVYNRIAEPKHYTDIVYKLIVDIGRKFLIDGQTTGESAEQLQRYARSISLLKTDTNLQTKRTAILRELQQLRKLCHQLDIFMAEDNSNKGGGSVALNNKKKLTLEEEFIYQLKPKAIVNGLPKGFVCCLCEQPQDVVKCVKCLRHLHLACITTDPSKKKSLEVLVEEQRFICDECAEAEKEARLRNMECVVCHDELEDSETKYRCTSKLCSSQYHLSCLRLFPHVKVLSPQTIICPYHVCHTCVSNDPREKASTAKASLVHCIKCPTAYHPSMDCIPAGTEMLTTQQLICPKHSLDQVALNVNWCFICCKGGNLICCETCPNAVHLDCLSSTVTEDKYICDECESGRLPLYNEIVIAKFSHFRWWPALIVPPSEISESMLKQRPSASAICVKFFYSRTMSWLNRRRMYLYQHEDSQNLGAKRSGSLDKQYRMAMAEASQIYQIMQSTKATQESGVAQKQKICIPMFTKIKVNRYIAPLKQRSAICDSKCNCLPEDEDPCGPTSSCINRAIMIECTPKTCPAKTRCSNQRFSKRCYPLMEVKYFPGKGYGLVANEAIECGQFVIEYVGEVINSQEFDRRFKAMQEQKIENYYFLTVDPDMTIDGGAKGNLSRFMNHSCAPNCETQKWTIGNTRVIGLFAIQDIQVGEELTFNYNLQILGNKKHACLCGAEKCSGFIGQKYRPPKEDPSRKNSNQRQVARATVKKTINHSTRKGQFLPKKNKETNNGEPFPIDVSKIKKEKPEII